MVGGLEFFGKSGGPVSQRGPVAAFLCAVTLFYLGINIVVYFCLFLFFNTERFYLWFYLINIFF